MPHGSAHVTLSQGRSQGDERRGSCGRWAGRQCWRTEDLPRGLPAALVAAVATQVQRPDARGGTRGAGGPAGAGSLAAPLF